MQNIFHVVWKKIGKKSWEMEREDGRQQGARVKKYEIKFDMKTM